MLAMSPIALSFLHIIFIAINFTAKDQKEVIKFMWDSQIYLVHMAIGFYFGDHPRGRR